MFIDGEKYIPSHAEKIQVLNPATGELICSIPAASEKEVQKAVFSGVAAFQSWAKKSYSERCAVLSDISSALKEKEISEKLAVLLTNEQGKPLQEARREIEGVTEVIDYFIGLSSAIHTDFYTNEKNNGYSFTIQKPLGVCASVLPWNMPALIFSWKVIPALLTGNVCLVKPSSVCPLTILEMADVFHKAGLPPGVLNVIAGSGKEIGNQLAAEPAVRKISFTGSANAGRELHAKAALNNKRVTLELGGSDAMIVCDDIDIADCAQKAVHARFFNCGQTCISPKRLFVFESVYDEFIKHVLDLVSKIKVGNGVLPETTMGPLSSQKELENMIRFVSSVRDENPKAILTGGNVLKSESFSNGFFFEPTVLSGISLDSSVMTEEVFGPLLVIHPVKDMDEALKCANQTRYGLGGSVWTNDLKQAKKAIEGLDVGIVWVNQHTKVLPELPFGGVKESGFGRENGYEILKDYLETKTVVFKF